MLYEVLKTAKMGAGKAPDLYTALLAKNLRRDGEVKTLSGIPPLTFTSNGQPLLDYLISGNTVQSSTPTPGNPVMPQGTGERADNLCDESAIQQGYYGALGSYSVFTADTKYRCFKLDLPAGIYTLNISAEEDMHILRCSNSVDGTIAVYSAPPYTFTLSADATIYVSWRNTDTTNSFTNMKVMLNTGSSPLPFEPYGYKLDISSGGTTTPIYLGEVQTTRKVKKLVLTGDENWYVEGSDIFYTDPITEAVRYTPICSHFIGMNTLTGNNQVTISQSLRINIKTTTITHTANDFKTYLAQQYAAGTPVTVWYVLATPETAVVNEPLMKIGDYADTVSMEQAGVEIPTVRGTNTLDVLTDVKPSEVYIKYKE